MVVQCSMANILRDPPLDKHPVAKWHPNEKLRGVCWLWDANEKLLEVLATTDVRITLREIHEVRSGPRAYVHYISFEEILDQQARDQRVQIAIERWKPIHQTPHLPRTDPTA